MTTGGITGTFTGLPESGVSVSGYANVSLGAQQISANYATFTNTGADFSLTLPNVPAATYDMTVEGYLAGRTISYTAKGQTIGATFPAISFVEPPGLIEPIDGSLAVTKDSEFRYQPQSGSVHAVHFWTNDSHYVVVTMGDHVSFPDFATLGLAAPGAGDEVEWMVYAYPSATLDDGLTATGFDNPERLPASTSLFVRGQSDGRTFSFVP